MSHLDAESFAKLKDAGPFDRAGCILILIGGVLVSIYALIFTTIVINKTENLSLLKPVNYFDIHTTYT